METVETLRARYRNASDDDLRAILDAGTGESFIRQLDLFVLNMVPVVGWLVEPIIILASEEGRRLGDRAANTQVIDVSEWLPRKASGDEETGAP